MRSLDRIPSGALHFSEIKYAIVTRTIKTKEPKRDNKNLVSFATIWNRPHNIKFSLVKGTEFIYLDIIINQAT